MSKHTPGPWEERADAHGRGKIYAGGVWIATTWLGTGEGNDAPQLPALGNAALIAAAPDLLEVLKYVRAVLPQERWADDTNKMIDAAIAKATGEQK